MTNRDEAATRLMQALHDKGIEYLRFELPDMHGVSRSKVVPADKVEAFARRGLNFYGGVIGLDTSSNVVPASGMPSARISPRDPATSLCASFQRSTRARVMSDARL